MEFGISEQQKQLYDDIVRFCQKELTPGAAQRDRDQRFPRDLWIKCGEFGLMGLMVPAEFGGSGLDALSAALALEALGYGSADGGLNFAICAHVLSCLVPLWKHGTEAQKRRYLPGLCSGALIAANAMTESAGGSDAFHMLTTASMDGDAFVLSGTKTFCSNGPHADVAVVYAVTDQAKGFSGGITAFLVEKGARGFSVGQHFEKMGLRSAPLSELIFDNVRVSHEAVIGGVGAGGPIFNESMEWERSCLVACHVGTMQRLLEEAISHAQTRKTAEQPIGKFQSISHRIADMKVRLEASRLLAYRAAWQLGRAKSAGLDASIAKLYASETLKQMALDLVQIMGGYGYMTDYPAERMLRDAVAATIYSGTSEIQKNIIARWLGL